LDPGGAQAKDRFGSFEFPESYLIRESPKGSVVLKKWVGPVKWGSVSVNREIDEAIARPR
jgi:hypothetical protein